MEVTSVTVTDVRPNPTRVNEPVNITAVASLDSTGTGFDCVEFVLALGSKDTIIKVYSVPIQPGASSARVTFQVTFSLPGTYTMLVGARYKISCIDRPR